MGNIKIETTCLISSSVYQDINYICGADEYDFASSRLQGECFTLSYDPMYLPAFNHSYPMRYHGGISVYTLSG